MLPNRVKGSSRLIEPRLSRGRRRRWLAVLAALLGAWGIGSATASPVTLTFAQLVACPLNILASKDPAAAQAGLPENLRAAVGREVQIAGYMLPLVVENGRASQLLLLRNTLACCYGQSPAANEYLVVKTPPPGLPVTMDVPVAVRGRLRVEPVMLGGLLVEYFHLDEAALVAR